MERKIKVRSEAKTRLLGLIVRFFLFHLLLSAGSAVDPRKVLIVAGHHNWIVAAYAHFVICYR